MATLRYSELSVGTYRVCADALPNQGVVLRVTFGAGIVSAAIRLQLNVGQSPPT
jgi:hypothetical protein